MLYIALVIFYPFHGMEVMLLMMPCYAAIKLLYYAGSHDVEYIRVGTSGGIGVEPGTVVVTKMLICLIWHPTILLMS